MWQSPCNVWTWQDAVHRRNEYRAQMDQGPCPPTRRPRPLPCEGPEGFKPGADRPSGPLRAIAPWRAPLSLRREDIDKPDIPLVVQISVTVSLENDRQRLVTPDARAHVICALVFCAVCHRPSSTYSIIATINRNISFQSRGSIWCLQVLPFGPA